MAYLNGLAVWSATGVSSLGVVVTLLASSVFVPHGTGWSVVTVGLCMGAAFLWAMSVHRLTRPRQLGEAASLNTHAEWSGLRLWTRVATWIGVAGLAIAFVAATSYFGAARAATQVIPAPSAFVVLCLGASGLMLLGGFVGLVLAAIYFSLLADWANDLGLAMRLRAVPFVILLSIPVGVLLLFMIGLTRATARMVIIAPAILIIGGGMLVCVWFMASPFVQFAALCHWARRNQHAALSRDRRASAAIVRRIEEGRAKDEPAPRASAGGPSKPPGESAPPTRTAGYDLAPPEGDPRRSP